MLHPKRSKEIMNPGFVLRLLLMNSTMEITEQIRTKNTQIFKIYIRALKQTESRSLK